MRSLSLRGLIMWAIECTKHTGIKQYGWKIAALLRSMVHRKSAHGGVRRCQNAGHRTSIRNGCQINRVQSWRGWVTFLTENTSVTDVESHSSAICGRKSFLPLQLYAIYWVISISYLVIVMLIYKHFIIDNTKQWRCRRWSLWYLINFMQATRESSTSTMPALKVTD